MSIHISIITIHQIWPSWQSNKLHHRNVKTHCTQSQYNSILPRSVASYSVIRIIAKQIQITFTITQFTILWLAMHDDVTGIKVFNKCQITCHILQFTFQLDKSHFREYRQMNSAIY